MKAGWLASLLGIQGDEQDNSPSLWETLMKKKDEVKSSLGNFLGGQESISYTKPEEQLQQERMVTADKFKSLGWNVPNETSAQPTMQQTQPAQPAVQPQATQDNPYADWTKEQLKADIRPDVSEYLDNILIPAVKEVHPAIAASQWAIEGGRNTKNNPFGLMRNDEVLDYGTLEDNIRAYEETVKDIVATNMGIDEKDLDLKSTDPETVLYFLQFQANGQPGKKRYEAHMPDPQSYIDMIHAMPEWRYYK